MSYEDKNFRGSLVLDFGIWWRDVKTIYWSWLKINITWHQSRNTCSVFSLRDFELIFWAFSVVLCTLREIMKQCCCNNNMDQLSFLYFPQSMAHKWNKNRLECSTIEFFEHTALCKLEKRLSQTFAFYLCEPRLPRKFFPYYYSRNDTLLYSTCFSSISDIPRCILSP